MIYTEGCLPKASQWFERHILPVAIVIVILAVLQVKNKYRLSFCNILYDSRYLVFVLLKIFVMIFLLKKRNGHGMLIP
jgi:hypothetical protein